MLPLIIEPEAEADILEAHDWYEKQREGLGEDSTSVLTPQCFLCSNIPGHFRKCIKMFAGS